MILHGGPVKYPYIGTFHSLGARILRKECRLLGREPNFAIFDDHDSFDLVKKAVKGISLAKKLTMRTTPRSVKKDEAPAFFAQKISEIKNDVFMKGDRLIRFRRKKKARSGRSLVHMNPRLKGIMLLTSMT